MIGIDIGSCNQDPETCPALKQVFEQDAFYETVSGIDPNAEEIRAMLGDFATACAKGTCPGRNIELTREVLRRHIEKGNQ